MRNTIVNAIHEEAKKNKSIFFLTADLGYSVIDDFKNELPEQCLNLGISEQNVIGVAAGLALAGKKVFVYSIVPFVTTRCLDQIKMDICYQDLDVTIVGIGGGMAYGTHGYSHYGLEQLAQMKAFPNMKIICPADAVETREIMKQVFKTNGPTYIHLNRGGEKDLDVPAGDIMLGQGRVLKKGLDATLYTIGNLADTALKAAIDLQNHGIDLEVVHFNTLKPIDEDLIIRTAKGKKMIFSLEEQFIDGGFGSSVADVCAKNAFGIPLHKFGVENYLPIMGNQEFLRDKAGISPNQIVSRIRSLWKK